MPLDPSKAPQGPRDAAEIRERARIRQTGGLEPCTGPPRPSPPDAWQPHSRYGWPTRAGPYYRGPGMPDPTPRPGLSTVTIGALCGIAAATCWGAGFVAAKHGIAKGLAPTDLAFHRFVWSGLLLMPLVARAGLGDLGGVGWPRGLVILLLAGPLQAITSYTGFTLAPLGHGAVIHPASRGPGRHPAGLSRAGRAADADTDRGRCGDRARPDRVCGRGHHHARRRRAFGRRCCLRAPG